MVESAPSASFKCNDGVFCVVELRDAKDSPIRGVGIAKCTIAAAHWNAAAQEHRYSLHLHVSRPNGTSAKVHVEDVPGGLLSSCVPEEADAKSGLVLAQMSSAPVPWVSPLFQIEKSFMLSDRAEDFKVATAAERRQRHMVGPPVLPLRLAVDRVFADLGVLDLIAPFLDQEDLVRIQAASRSLRHAGFESTVVNRDIHACLQNANHVESFKLWVIPRGALVQSLSLTLETDGNLGHIGEPVTEMFDYFRILKLFKFDANIEWTPSVTLWKLPLEDLTLGCHVDIPEIAPGYMQQLTKLAIVVQDFFPEGLCQFRQLKDLALTHIEGTLQDMEFPAKISQLSALESLKIEGDYSDLNSLSPQIGLLTTLQSFRLVNFEFESLPVEIYQLTALRILELVNCGNVGPLPSAIGGLTALENLVISHCQGITSLPPEISRLERLQTVKIVYADFKSLPPEIGRLRSCLRSLELVDCGELQSLPPEIVQCSALEELLVEYLNCISSFTTLPPNLSDLSLRSLSLSGCDLHALPSAIGHLGALQTLNLHYCEKLNSLPEEIGQLTALTSLDLSFCMSLTALPQSISRLSNLEVLDIKQCKRLRTLNLADILHLTKLKELDMSSCNKLVFGSGDDMN